MSAAKKIIIWGAGGHAMVVTDILRLNDRFDIAGFLDDSNPTHHGQPFCGSTILGGQEQLPLLHSQGITTIILAFGDCAARLKLASIAKEKGFTLATAIHPSAIIAQGVPIGAGTVIAAGAIVNPASIIGDNVIVNTAASIDHECAIEDGAHISPGARLGGAVKIGRAAWIGIGAVVLPKVTIGEGAIIGAGAVVLDNIPARVVAFGVPAKVIRSLPE